MNEGYLPLGERIRHRRRVRGLSQLRLAGLIDRSEDWVSKVERGEIPVDRISVLLRVAEALKVPLSDLLGEQNLPRQQADASAAETDALRRALWAMSPPDGAAGDLAELGHRLEYAARMRADARYAEAASALAGLIGDLEGALRAHEGEPRRRARVLLARAYGLAVATLVRYGEHDAAWVAADRAVREAEQTGDPTEWLLAAYRLSHAFLGAGRLDEAVETANAAMERAADVTEAPEVRALVGALHLPLAIAAARDGDRGRAYEAIRDAGALAGESLSDDLRMATQFGPVNVAMHDVSVAVDLGDAGEALRLAESIEVERASVSRRSRHLVDVALAHSYRRDTDGMVEALARVERLAPEQLLHLPLVREMLHHALRRERGRPNAELHRLAARASAV